MMKSGTKNGSTTTTATKVTAKDSEPEGERPEVKDVERRPEQAAADGLLQLNCKGKVFLTFSITLFTFFFYFSFILGRIPLTSSSLTFLTFLTFVLFKVKQVKEVLYQTAAGRVTVC
ncbi:hypothetical protein TYRP_020988 [Tyrophagus putrescentiae]|nr:hypothetical protein TYRP_020988 [Tyrophagus putrescentiae]